MLEELKIQDEVTETKPSPGGHSVTTDEDFLASDSDVFGAGLRLELQQSPDDEPDESYEGIGIISFLFTRSNVQTNFIF